ncbi:MAG: T9SS type A sorting domain-containing protein [bacterium]
MNPGNVIFKFAFVILFFIYFIQTAITQPLIWRTLPNSPVTNGYRFDDIFFVNPQVGWVCGISGRMYKTTDGGNSWNLLISNSSFLFRCIGFSDSLNGYAGLYTLPSGSTAPLLKTTNGGLNWFGVQNIPAPIPAGICGISIVNNLVMYGVGKIDGPASVIKTTDGGTSWQSFNMTGLASRLVDCYFFSKDSGFVVGGIGSINTSSDVILFTSNGGANWQPKYTSFQMPGLFESCWKINFINRMNAVVSLNRISDSLSFLKTSNGGVTWQRNAYRISTSYFTQGIGFINETTGWLGGEDHTYETTDAGQTWNLNPFGQNVNRIRFLNDTLGYSVGVTVYKYSRDSITGIGINSNIIPNIFLLEQNYPNPFNPFTKFKFEVPKESFVKLSVIDVLGKEINILVNDYLSGGTYHTTWNGKDLNGNDVPSGLYFYRMETKYYSITKKMLLVK